MALRTPIDLRALLTMAALLSVAAPSCRQDTVRAPSNSAPAVFTALTSHLLRYSPSGIRDRHPPNPATGYPPFLVTVMTADDPSWANYCSPERDPAIAPHDLRPALAAVDAVTLPSHLPAVIWPVAPDSL